MLVVIRMERCAMNMEGIWGADVVPPRRVAAVLIRVRTG